MSAPPIRRRELAGSCPRIRGSASGSMVVTNTPTTRGKTQTEIAELLGVCERTVRNHLKAMPAARKKPRRGSKVDVFKATIDAILDANPCYNGELIYETLQKLGYDGKISVMKDFVASIRRKLRLHAAKPGRAGHVGIRRRRGKPGGVFFSHPACGEMKPSRPPTASRPLPG